MFAYGRSFNPKKHAHIAVTVMPPGSEAVCQCQSFGLCSTMIITELFTGKGADHSWKLLLTVYAQ